MATATGTERDFTAQVSAKVWVWLLDFGVWKHLVPERLGLGSVLIPRLGNVLIARFRNASASNGMSVLGSVA